MNVSAVIPTRGDVDLKPILRSLPAAWEVIVYNNGAGGVYKRVAEDLLARVVTGRGELPDLAVYARYAAIEYAENDLILTQDDDCVVSDPQAIVTRWLTDARIDFEGHVVCNMPANFRHAFYQEHGLVGFGACFHRDAPARAFGEYAIARSDGNPYEMVDVAIREGDFFRRTCDIVFTALTPRVLVDVPYDDLPWASAENRMWKQPTHREERQKMLDLVLKVRDS